MSCTNASKTVLTECRDGILEIVINRPEKKNALTVEMYRTMADAIFGAEEDAAVRVLLLHGAGGCFTSGNDLKDFMNSPPKDESSPVFRFLAAVSRARKPLVAAVAGAAVGIGTTVLLHCDLVYAGKSALFQLPFVNLGLCPEAASSLLFPQLAGHRRAAELLLLGEPFSAEKAMEIGLINSIHPDDELLTTARAQARKLAEKPPASVILTKALLKKANAALVRDTIAEEVRHFMERLASPEAAEAFQAFFERRKPDFSRFR